MRFVEGKHVTFTNVARDVVLKRTGGFINLFRGLGWYWISAAGMFGIMQALKSAADPFMEDSDNEHNTNTNTTTSTVSTTSTTSTTRNKQ